MPVQKNERVQILPFALLINRTAYVKIVDIQMRRNASMNVAVAANGNWTTLLVARLVLVFDEGQTP